MGLSTSCTRCLSICESAPRDQDAGIIGFEPECDSSRRPTLEVQRAIDNHSIAEGGDMSSAIEDLLSLETIQQLDRGNQQQKLDSKVPDHSYQQEEGDDWRNFFIKPDAPSAVKAPPVGQFDSVPERLELSIEPVEVTSHDDGPRPNDRPALPLNTQMYSRISQPSGSTPAVSDTESLDDVPGTPKVRKVKPITNTGRYASLASLPRETYNGFSSGDESAGSTRSRRSVGKPSKAIPLRDFEQRLQGQGSSLPPRRRQGDSSWGTLESLATYLAELVVQPSADTSFFLTYFHSPNHTSGYAAVREALVKAGTPLTGLRAELSMVREIRAGIEQSIHTQTSDEDIGVCVGAAGDVSRALDLLALLEEIKSWGGGSLESLGWLGAARDTPATSRPKVAEKAQRLENPVDVQTSSSRRLFPPDPKMPKRKKKDEHPQNWRVVRKEKEKKPRSSHRLAEFIPGYAKSSFGPDAVLFDMDEGRRRASEERLKREAAVRQAGRHFRSGGNGGSRGKQVAAFYAGEARRYEAAARSWELRAAEELVNHQR
jgi:hypothetical protein